MPVLKNIKENLVPGILNSYSIIFFLNNRLMAVALLIVSFFNFYAGLSGLYAVILTLLVGESMQLDNTVLRKGIYSFNGLLTGIGMGTFFDPSLVYLSLLTLVTLLCLFLSVAMGGWLNQYKLPHLSIPFVLSFWLILLPSAQYGHLGLTQRNIYWMNEMYAMGGNSLLNFFQTIDSLPVNKLVDIYLRSLSSIFFQSNLISGILIALALFISSRIFFSLSIIGFLSAYLFAQFSGSETASITYYNIGANYMMVAFAIGAFFVVPSKKSYLWTILLIPITSLVLLFFYKILVYIHLPVFSLPFSVVVILFVYFLQMRTGKSGIRLTPMQHYSPETNLYLYHNNEDRLSRFLFFPVFLPFWGEWTVSQGHDGEYTHLGEWGKAFDFVIDDDNGKTFRTNGLKPEDYHCWGKPVVAPASGTIELIVDEVEDNEIGTVDTINNWGNSIIIKHAIGLYSQISHLKKNSIRVKQGEYVKTGDLLAYCGNSGRSPEPHLHFQLQAYPVLGAKTIDYPVAYFFRSENGKAELMQYAKPIEGSRISNVAPDRTLSKAFRMFPGTRMTFNFTDSQGEEGTESWEAFTDELNYKYLWCEKTKSAAYYVNDGLIFCFTAFYGDRNSLLYSFYLSAYKVPLSTEISQSITDILPLSELKNRYLTKWLQDFTAPFFRYLHLRYTIQPYFLTDMTDDSVIELKSFVEIKKYHSLNKLSQAKIVIDANGILEFQFITTKHNLFAKCVRI